MRPSWRSARTSQPAGEFTEKPMGSLCVTHCSAADAFWAAHKPDTSIINNEPIHTVVAYTFVPCKCFMSTAPFAVRQATVMYRQIRARLENHPFTESRDEESSICSEPTAGSRVTVRKPARPAVAGRGLPNVPEISAANHEEFETAVSARGHGGSAKEAAPGRAVREPAGPAITRRRLPDMPQVSVVAYNEKLQPSIGAASQNRV